MRFTEPLSPKLCIPTMMFYSTILTSKCRAYDYVPGYPSEDEDDESIHIYRTELPWRPIHLDGEKNHFAVVAWTAVLSVAVSVAAIVCLCCLCWKLYPKYGSRRQSSNAALVPSPPSSAVDRARHGRVGRDSRRGNSHNTGVTHFRNTVDSLRHPTSNPLPEDGPPAYSIVISETLPDDKLTSETKTVETPPPAYVTVAPFNNNSTGM